MNSTKWRTLNSTKSRMLNSTVFSGKIFYIDENYGNEKLKLNEVVKQCGGQVERSLTENVTHVIAENTRHDKFRRMVNKSVCIVSYKWVYLCSKFNKIIPSNQYSPDKRNKLLNFNNYVTMRNYSAKGNITEFNDECDSTSNMNIQPNYTSNIDETENTGGLSEDEENTHVYECDSRSVVSIPINILIELISLLKSTTDVRTRRILEQLKVSLALSQKGCHKLLSILQKQHNHKKIDECISTSSSDIESDSFEDSSDVSVFRKPSNTRRMKYNDCNKKNSSNNDKKNENNDKKSNDKNENIADYNTKITDHENKRRSYKNTNQDGRNVLPSNNVVILIKDKTGNISEKSAGNETEVINGSKDKRRCSTIYKVAKKMNDEVRGSSSLFESPKCRIRTSKPGIVCTYFNSMELKVLYAIIKQLGVFEIENSVSPRTTHVICDSSKKTLNLYKAIARGCWILNRDWVFSSAQEKRWLFEETYERTDLTPAVRECRIKRQDYGVTYSSDLFENCGTIHISDKCHFSKFDLIELISLCGGSVVNNEKIADIVVGGNQTHKCLVKEEESVLW